MRFIKLIGIIFAVFLLDAAAVFAAPTAGFITPSADISVPEGYPAVLRVSVSADGETVRRVILCRNGEEIGEMNLSGKDGAAEYSYAFAEGALETGDYTFTAKLVCSDTEYMSSARKISVVSMSKVLISSEDFEGDSYVFTDSSSKTPLTEENVNQIPEEIMSKPNGISKPSGKALHHHRDAEPGVGGTDSNT